MRATVTSISIFLVVKSTNLRRIPDAARIGSAYTEKDLSLSGISVMLLRMCLPAVLMAGTQRMNDGLEHWEANEIVLSMMPMASIGHYSR
jgi:hypothetical protein